MPQIKTKSLSISQSRSRLRHRTSFLQGSPIRTFVKSDNKNTHGMSQNFNIVTLDITIQNNYKTMINKPSH